MGIASKLTSPQGTQPAQPAPAGPTAGFPQAGFPAATDSAAPTPASWLTGTAPFTPASNPPTGQGRSSDPGVAYPFGPASHPPTGQGQPSGPGVAYPTIMYSPPQPVPAATPTYPPILHPPPAAPSLQPVQSFPATHAYRTQNSLQPSPAPAYQHSQSFPAHSHYAHQGVAMRQPVGLGQFEDGAIEKKLMSLVEQNGLQSFYSAQAVVQLAYRVAHLDVASLGRQWKLPAAMMLDLVGLALYDTVILVDDSGSMKNVDGGERIRDLMAILERVSTVCGLLDMDGIAIHAMNSDASSEHVRSSDEAASFVRTINFGGATPLGTMLDRKIVQPYVLRPAKNRILRKPVHVIVITDGEPTSENSGQVRSTIAKTKDYLKSSPYGAGACAYQFAQVGTDKKAQDFLSKLDNDSKIGRLVDCTSSFEQEQEEYLKKSGLDLTPDMYLNKLCLGAIDRSYDEQDEDPAQGRKKPGILRRLNTLILS